MDLIRDSIMRAKLSANSGRKLEAQKRIDYYNGVQLDHLDKVLARQFKHPERLRLQKSFSNIVRRIINEVSVVYKKAPERSMVDKKGNKIEGKGGEAFAKMYAGARANSVLKKVNRFTNLVNTVCVQAVWRNDRLDLDILTPDILNVVQDPMDPTAAQAVIVEQGFCDTVALEYDGNPFGAHRLYIAWTPEQHMVYDERGRVRADLANEAGVNPYGIIPMAVFRSDFPDKSFWNEGSDDLINAQDTLNIFLTELNQLVKMQSFSVPVIIGDAPPEGITVDPSNFISIPLAESSKGQPDFKFVSPSPKINEILEVIRECVRRIADDWGLSMANFTLSGSPASGLSLRLSNIRLLERREDDIELYLDYEKSLFRVMRAVWNAHSAPIDRIPEDSDISVNFAEMDFPSDPAAEDARWVVQIQNNIKTRAQWLMSTDSDIKDVAEAEIRLAENKEANAANRNDPMVLGNGLMDTLTGKPNNGGKA